MLCKAVLLRHYLNTLLFHLVCQYYELLLLLLLYTTAHLQIPLIFKTNQINIDE